MNVQLFKTIIYIYIYIIICYQCLKQQKKIFSFCDLKNTSLKFSSGGQRYL